jgi:DMSO/TMAO reductase YedYZ molybdopterin-dependent catalytic subunit
VDWDQFRELPSERIVTDIHCVTRWSKLGTAWPGVSADLLLTEVEYSVGCATAFCDGGYTDGRMR